MATSIFRGRAPTNLPRKEGADTPPESKDSSGWAVQIIKEGVKIKLVNLSREKSSIGRMAQNQIVLDHPSISRSHALITRVDQRFFISDQGSQNGTFLNGRSVLQEEFKVGDLITIGPFTLKLVQLDPKDPNKKETNADGTSEQELTL